LRTEAVDAVEDVVALDVGDVDVEAEAGAEITHLPGAAGRVEPAGVGDHLDAPVDAGAEHLLHLGQERACVAGLGVTGALLVQDQHRQLGQPVTREHVDGTVVEDGRIDHLTCGGDAVAEET
jgi:hypothetical protein